MTLSRWGHPSAVDRLRATVYLLKSLGAGAEQIGLIKDFLLCTLAEERSDTEHLKAAMDWLLRAQDNGAGGGVSCVYDLKAGWGVPYPETSGYIIATFLAYAEMFRDDVFVDRAVRIGDWEVKIQTPGGGVLSNPLHPYTRVFNTGQVMLGWCALYEKTRQENYLAAACRAGDYLLCIQEPDGSWTKDTYCGARTYHARVDWSLLRLARLTGREAYAAAAAKNIGWVLAQQQPNGWFAMCGFNQDDPIMHVIVYTLRGLLESHLQGSPATRGLDILPRVVRGADALCAAAERHPVRNIAWMVPTSFDRNWQTRDTHSCLTGNSQFAGFLFRLAQATSNPRYRSIGEHVLGCTKRTQLLSTSFPEIRGAIAGSYPLYEGYHPNSYPNWATKFFADALMMKLGFEQGRTVVG